MLRLIAFLWTGCWHKWEIIAKRAVVESAASKIPWATAYDLQCKHCGNIKSKTVNP